MDNPEEIIHDIPDPTPHLPGVAIPVWIWVLLALGVLAILLLLIAAILLRNKAAAPKSIEDVYKISREQLDALRGDIEDSPLAEIATQASFAIRYYLAACLGEPALFETHEEFTLRADALNKLPAGSREHLNPLLEKLAECKYGPSTRDADQAGSLLDQCIAVLKGLESTRPPRHRMSRIFQHFAFGDPLWLLLLLALIPLLFLSRRPGAASSIGFSSLSILGSVGQRTNQRTGSFSTTLLLLAVVTAILALSRPQWRSEFTARNASGIDIIIALDVSYSMEIPDFYRNDDPDLPGKRRIDVAKTVIEDFIKRRDDDRLGLIAFAGRPYAVSPITLDHDWLVMNLRRLQLGDIQEQGTAIGSAIAASSTRLTKREAKSKVIVLVTDGANNSGKLDPVEAAKLASKLGVKVYTIAIGTEGGRLPNGRQPFPRQEFDESTLIEIARLTGGEYFRARDNAALRNTFNSIDSFEKTEVQSHTVVDADEFYPWLIGATFALSFLAISIRGLNPPPMPS